VIALSREFPSIFGAPSIHEVDERVFTLRYFGACLACDFCHDACCNHGVDVDWANMEALRSLGSDFAKFVGVPPDKWFTADLVHDAEFPSGAHARTQARDGKCVFAERAGRGCRIHAICAQNGLDYHLYKPLVSILFPLTFEAGALVPASEALDASLVCGGVGECLYSGVRDELAYYFGEAFTTELDVLATR
jgi:hypothetical protein